TRVRPRASTPSRTPSREPHGEAARASSTTTSDRAPAPGSPAAENRAATSSPNTAKRCPVRWRSPQNNQPCACGSNAPAAATARPSSARNKPGTPSRQRDQNHPRSALPEAGRKTHAPASAVSPPRSRSDRPADRPRAPSPCRQTRSVSLLHTESTKSDFVNGLVERVAWQQADATALPFDDARFDAVVCQFGAMFFPDKGGCLSRGVARPET